MLSNFFGKSKPVNYIVLFVLMALYFCLSFFVFFSTESIDINIVFKQLGFFALVLSYCFLYGFILAKNKLTLGNTYGFLILVSLFGVFPHIYTQTGPLIFNILLLVFIRKILSFRTSKSFFEKLFDSGFWLAILFILEPFSLIFGILIYLSVSLFQKTNFQTLFIPLVGFLLPMIIYFSYCFWFDVLDDFYTLFYLYSSFSIDPYLSDPLRVPLFILGIFSFIALIFKTPKVFLISGNYRKYWIIIFVIFLLSLFYLVLKNDKGGSELLVVMFPVSILLANWVESIEKKVLKEIAVIGLVVLPVIFFIV